MDKSLTTKRFGWVVNLLAARNLIKSKRNLAGKLGTYSTKLSEILAERMYVSGEIIYQMSQLFPMIPYEFYFVELPSNGIETEEELRDHILERIDNWSEEVVEEEKEKGSLLPILPVKVVAGFCGVDFDGVDFARCEKIDMPYFVDLGVEFLINVMGNSMQPNYNNGDLLGCRRVKDITYIKWGKVYLLDSREGAMLKRIFPSSDPELVECRSDNPEVAPFTLRKDDIRSLAEVLAVLRVE